MAKLIFHPEADGEYRGAFQWYEARSPQAAIKFETDVEEVLMRIIAAPESFLVMMRNTVLRLSNGFRIASYIKQYSAIFILRR